MSSHDVDSLKNQRALVSRMQSDRREWWRIDRATDAAASFLDARHYHQLAHHRIGFGARLDFPVKHRDLLTQRLKGHC